MLGTKFRVWKKSDTPEMFTDVNVINFKKNTIVVAFPISTQTMRSDVESLDNVVLMQYTGLKDNKGVEIYEGDIVKRTYLFDGMFGKTHIGEVVYDKEYARYVISKPQKYTEPKNEDLGNTLSNRSTYEVIGNIYENLELLED